VPIAERLLAIYLGIGILGALLLFVGLTWIVIRHNRWGETLKLIAPYLLRERNSFVVVASLLLFILCYGYNFVILWPALFIPRLLGSKHRPRLPAQSAYETLAAANLNPTLDIDYFLWPTAGAILGLALYASSYAHLPIPYATAATVLWIGSMARLAYYTIPSMTPAFEDVPTFLRRRYPKPRRMYLMLLAIEGASLVPLLPVVIFRIPPATVTLAQHRVLLGGFYRPDDWLTLLTTWPPTRQAWIANGSGLLFDSALLAYLFRCFLSVELVGWDDPFRMNDDDHLALAEAAIKTDSFHDAADHLDRLESRSERSYRLSAQLHLRLGDVQEASREVATRRDLLKRHADQANVFHELLSYPRKGDRSVERLILRWALQRYVPDEDIAHALISLESDAKGASLVDDILEALQGQPPTPERDRRTALQAMATTHPLTTGMILIRALPDSVDDDLRQTVTDELRHLSLLDSAFTPLRTAQVDFQLGDHTVDGLKALIESIEYMIREGRDEDEVGRVMSYIMSRAQRLRRQNDRVVVGDALLECWRTIMLEAKAQGRYGYQLHFMMGDVASALKKMAG